jgi:hypothetical protein
MISLWIVVISINGGAVASAEDVKELQRQYTMIFAGSDQSSAYLDNRQRMADTRRDEGHDAILFTIFSDGILLSGSNFHIDGEGYDNETTTVFGLTADAVLYGPVCRIHGLPPGRYRVQLSNKGEPLSSKIIEYRGGIVSTDIRIEKAKKFIGRAFYPGNASNARIRYGGMGVMLKNNSQFEISANEWTEKYPFLYFECPVPDNCIRNYLGKSFTCEAFFTSMPSSEAISDIKGPDFGEWPSVIAQISLPEKLAASHADPKNLAMTLETRSVDGKFLVIHHVDPLGRVIITGLPDGKYRLSLASDSQNAPLEMTPIQFVATREAPQVFDIQVRPFARTN